jgi:hypothetical protein
MCMIIQEIIRKKWQIERQIVLGFPVKFQRLLVNQINVMCQEILICFQSE